jgi:hypothetical protein
MGGIYTVKSLMISTLEICERSNSRRIRRGGRVVCMEKGRGAYKVLVGKLEEKALLEDSGINGRVILKWISEHSVRRA